MNLFPLLAMGGGAEASLAVSLFFGWVTLWIVLGVAASAIAFRKKWLWWTAIILLVSSLILMVPWELYSYEPSLEDREDPDVMMWLERFRFQLYSETVLLSTAIVLMCIYRPRKASVKSLKESDSECS